MTLKDKSSCELIHLVKTLRKKLKDKNEDLLASDPLLTILCGYPFYPSVGCIENIEGISLIDRLNGQPKNLIGMKDYNGFTPQNYNGNCIVVLENPQAYNILYPPNGQDNLKKVFENKNVQYTDKVTGKSYIYVFDTVGKEYGLYTCDTTQSVYNLSDKRVAKRAEVSGVSKVSYSYSSKKWTLPEPTIHKTVKQTTAPSKATITYIDNQTTTCKQITGDNHGTLYRVILSDNTSLAIKRLDGSLTYYFTFQSQAELDKANTNLNQQLPPGQIFPGSSELWVEIDISKKYIYKDPTHNDSVPSPMVP